MRSQIGKLREAVMPERIPQQGFAPPPINMDGWLEEIGFSTEIHRIRSADGLIMPGNDFKNLLIIFPAGKTKICNTMAQHILEILLVEQHLLFHTLKRNVCQKGVVFRVPTEGN